MIIKNFNISSKNLSIAILLTVVIWLDTLPLIPHSWITSPGRTLIPLIYSILWHNNSDKNLFWLMMVGLLSDVLNERIYGETSILLLLFAVLMKIQRPYVTTIGALSYIFYLIINIIIIDIIAITYLVFILEVSFSFIGIFAGWASSIFLGIVWYYPLKFLNSE